MNRHVSEGRIGNCEATSVNFREGNLPAANESTRDNKQKFRPKQMHEELEHYNRAPKTEGTTKQFLCAVNAKAN